jgi:hypothetical protein
MTKRTRQVNFSLPSEDYKLLEQEASEQEMTAAEACKRAVKLWMWMSRIRRQGKNIVVRTPEPSQPVIPGETDITFTF